MMRRNTLAALITLSACGTAGAQDYFDFDSIPGLPDQPTVQVDVSGALLDFAATASRGDPQAAALLEGVEGVRVRVYERLEDAAEVAAYVDDASGRLERDGWQRVVYVQDGENMVRMYARLDGTVMNGLTIMALCDDEAAAFVNVAGRIGAEQARRIAETMSVDGMFAGRPVRRR